MFWESINQAIITRLTESQHPNHLDREFDVGERNKVWAGDITYIPTKRSCASQRMGTITLFNDIRGELQQENIILSDELIADAMQGLIQHAEKKQYV